MTSSKTPASDRSHGGPGSSHEDATRPEHHPAGAHHQHQEASGTTPGAPTNPSRSQVSGGGGERDRHHTHDPARK